MTCEDFRKPDGSYDWGAYRAAKDAEHKADVADGKYCYQCGRYLVWSNKGVRRRCGDCEALDHESDEVDSDTCVRCPKCRRTASVSYDELFDLYEEGEHEVTCSSCDHEYTVSTRVSYSFNSPALEGSEDAEEDADV